VVGVCVAVCVSAQPRLYAARPAVFRGMQIFTLHRGIRRLPQNLLLALEKCGMSVFGYIYI